MGTESRTPPRLSAAEHLEFERLFKFYYRPVIGFFLKRDFSPAECEDLTQETFANAYRGFQSFRGESSDLTWLFSIARNILNNEVRRRKTQKREISPVSLEGLQETGPEISEMIEDGPGLDALDQALADEQRKIFAAALNELPQRRRQALHLRIVQDLKYREIANLLKVNVNTVKSHVSQAKAQLKARLGTGPPEEAADKEINP